MIKTTQEQIIYIFMSESRQDLDLPQSPLAVRLVLKWRDLLNGNFAILGVWVGNCVVDGRSESKTS